VSLVPAYLACAAPNRVHGTPLSFGSCAPPAPASNQLTVGSPDANGARANSIGSARFRVFAGDPATAANEADVAISVSITDVRQQGTLADYGGELQLDPEIRITDRLNGASETDAATVGEIDFPVTIPCAATPSSSIGGTCSAATTLNAVMPGAVVESQRSIWQLGAVRLLDGGPDGVAATTPNTLFATQGVYVP
jgi:hypothetical protein